MWYVELTKQAVKDLKKLKAAGLSPKAKSLVDVVSRDPFVRPPAYEPLVGNLTGFYSRRINIQHRFVYKVDPEPFSKDGVVFEGTVRVVRMWTHYEGL